MEPYRSENSDAGLGLPVTELLAERLFILPTGTEVGPGEVSGICEIIWTAHRNGEAVCRQLAVREHPHTKV